MDDYSPKSDDIDAEIDEILGTKSKKPAKIASPKTVSTDIDTEIDDILSGFGGADPVGKTVGKSAIKTARKRSSSPYDHLIEDSARRHGVDPDLIRRQMGTESSFNPKAKSHKNAMGLMQIIPSTAKRLGVGNVWDPQQNIEGGVKYMRQLLDMFGGDVNLALAGYNAGEGAVKKYGNKVPPYQETRNYVKKIGSGYTGNGYLRTKASNGGYQSAPPSSLAIGDSIAAGLIWHGGLGGNANKGVQRDFSKGATASVGSTPKEILANIQAMPDKAVRGQSVVLSTGASNDPKSLDVIQSQIDTLRKKGVTNITILGVGPHKNLIGVNDRLAKIAQDNGVTFTGALKTGKDQIHPTHWGKLAKSLPINAPAQAPQDVDPITSIDDEIDNLLAGIPQAPEVPDGSVYNKPLDTRDGRPDTARASDIGFDVPETGSPNELYQSRANQLENPVDITEVEKIVNQVANQKKASAPTIDMPDAPVTQATDADFEEANKYLASVGQPQITREQFDVAQKAGGTAQATGYTTQAQVAQGQVGGQAQQPQEIRGPIAEREPTRWKGAAPKPILGEDGQPRTDRNGKIMYGSARPLNDDELLKTDLSYLIDLSQVKGDKKAYAMRAVQNALMKKWGITAEQAAEFVPDDTDLTKDNAVRVYVNRGKLAGLVGEDKIRQDYDEERAGVTQDWYQANDTDIRSQQANKPTFDDVSREDFYRPTGDRLLDEARYNTIHSPRPFLGSEEEAVQQEYERLKKYSLSDDELAEATRAGENTANWFPNASAPLSGAMSGGGSVFHTLAGILGTSVAGVTGILPESWTIALSKAGTKMQTASGVEAKLKPGVLNKALRIGGSLPYDLARYALLARLPGGQNALFAISMGLESAGRGDRIETTAGEVAKGYVLDRLFKGGSKLAGKAEDFVGKAFKNPVFDRVGKGAIPDEKLKNLTDNLKFSAETELRMAKDPAFKAQVMADVRYAANEEWQKQILVNPQILANTPKERLAAKLFGEGAKVGMIGLGAAALKRVTSNASTPEEANEEAWNEGVTMALTSLALDHGKGAAKGMKDLVGRIYRATVGKKTADVTVMPNGDIKLLKGAVPEDVVDASVRVDNGEARFNEQAKNREDIAKSQKEGEAKLNNEIYKRQQAEKTEKLADRGLPEAPPKRVDSPTPEAVTKATNHPVAQRVSTILADGKPRTLDAIARESKLKSADKISEAIDTLYAAGQIQINPDGTVQVNGGERPDTSLYDQFDASGRVKPTTVPTTPVAPVVNTQDDDEDLPFTPASTVKPVDTKEYPPSGLPALVEADIRKDKFIHPQKNITDLAEQMGKTPDEIREILPTLPDYTDAQIAKKHGVTEAQVANLRPLGEIGHDGYTSHRVRATVLDPANEGMFNALSDIFTGGEVRFRDAEFETKGRMADAVLNKIAESVGKPRASQMTSQDWSKVLSVHADKLNIDDVDKLVTVAEEGKEYTKKFNALVTSPKMQAIVAQGMRDFGAVVNADGTIEYHGAPMTWEDLLEVDDNASGRKTGQTRSGGVTLPLRKMALALGKELGGIKENGKPLFTNEAIRRAHDTAVYARTSPASQSRSNTRKVATVSASSGKESPKRGTASAGSTQKVAPIKVVKKSEPKSEPKTETKTEPQKAPVVAEKVETREEVAPEPKKAPEVKKEPKKPTLEGTKEELKKEKAPIETLHSVPVTAKGQSTADAQVFIEADIDPTVKLTPNKTSSVWRVKSPDGIEVKGATYKEALDIAQRIADGVATGNYFSRARRAPATVGARAHNLTRDAGGTTVGLRGDEPKTGIAFAPTKGTERVVAMADFTPQSVDDFIETHRAELEKPGRYFGAWWNQEDGNVYMDISEVGDYTPETIQRAIDAKQLAAFDLGAGEEIPLGKIDAKGYNPLHEATAHPYLNSRQNVARGLQSDESGDEPSRERVGLASGRRHVEASTILRESGGSATPELGRYSYGQDKAPFEQEIKRQEDALEKYARDKGIWLDADALSRFELLNDPMAAGGESVVYLNDGNKTVTKVINPRAKGITPFGTPQQFIDNRISLYNEIFPETPYTLKQITRDNSGQFQFVLEQPFVIGTNPTNQKPIDDYMDGKGYYPYGFQGQYTNGVYKVIDLTPKNVLITEDGVVIPVDAITRPDEDALESEKGSFFSRPNTSTIPEGSWQWHPKGELVPIEFLNHIREYDRTDRKRIDDIKQSLIEEGFREPVIITAGKKSRTAKLSEGNHRLQAAKELGLTHIPARVIVWNEANPTSDQAFPTKTVAMSKVPADGYFKEEAKPSEVFDALSSPDMGTGDTYFSRPNVSTTAVLSQISRETLDAENEDLVRHLSYDFHGDWDRIGQGAQVHSDGAGTIVWLNREARLIVNNIYRETGVWSGVYNTLTGTTQLYRGLADFHTAAVAAGKPVLAKGIERVFNGIIDGIDLEYGDTILYAEVPDAPNLTQYGVQEEMAHRADLRTRKLASWKSIPEFEKNPAYAQAARNLLDGAYAGAPSVTIHHEIIGKIFRDDAEIELQLTYNQLQSIRLQHYEELIASGVTNAQIETAYKNISQNADKWLAAQRGQDAQPDAGRVDPTGSSKSPPQFSLSQKPRKGGVQGVGKTLKPFPFAKNRPSGVDEKGQRIPQTLFSRPTNVAGDAFPDIEGIPESELTMEAHRTRIEKLIADTLPKWLHWVYDGRREVTPAEAIGNTVRAGYLLGVSVVLTNVQGNPVNQVVEQGVKVFSGPLDWINSKINPKSGYERHNPGLSVIDIAHGMFGEKGALRKAVLSKGQGSIYEVLRKGVGDEEREKFDLLPLVQSKESKKGRWDENVVRNTGIPAWDAAIEASVRISSALDRPFKAFKNASEIRGLARLTATKLRKQGAITKTQYYDFVKELNKDPNAWMEAVAKRSAQIDTFQNPNAITDEINKIKKKLLTGRFASDVQDVQARQDAAKLVGQLLYLVMTTTAPFLNTPANIGIRALEYTPVGLALGAVRYAKIGKTLERLEWAERMAERRKKEDARIAKERLQENRDIKSVLDKYSAQKKAKKAERDQAIADIESSTVMQPEFKKARIKKAKENYKAWETGWTEAKAKRAQVVDGKLADAGTERAKIDAGIAADRAREDAEANRKFTALENNAFTSGLGRTAFGTTFGSLFFLGVLTGILEAVGYVTYDDDQKEWEKRRDAGIPDASIGAFGYRFPYDNSPLGKALAIGVTAMEQAQRGGSVEKRAEGSAKGVVKGLRNLFPYTENRFDTDDEWLEIGKTVKSATPFVNMKILEEAANIIDDKPRTTFKQGMTAPFKMTFAREGIPMLGIDPLPVTKHPMGKRHDSMLWRGLQTVNPMRSIKQVKEKNWAPSPHKK